jgi:hypothetical protein
MRGAAIPENAALELLRDAVDERCGRLIFGNIGHVLDSIRSDPRFKDLMRAVGMRLDA